MNLMDAIYTRRSTRGFTTDPVSRATVEQLMEAAVQAPSGMNAQPWAFGIVQDAGKLKDFSDRTKAYLLANMQTFPVFERYREWLANPDFQIFHNAPVLIIIFAKPGGPTADYDCAMAAQNLMLAAHDRGLGTCWIGFFGLLLGQPDVLKELHVPEGYRPIAPIVVGHPAQPVPPVEKAGPEVVFWEG